MKSIILALGLVIGTTAAGVALADDAALARKKNCMACHTVDKKIVGPAYKDVARKYAGQADAEARLAEKIVKGGKGSWGDVPMPPNATVKPGEAAALARWILCLR